MTNGASRSRRLGVRLALAIGSLIYSACHPVTPPQTTGSNAQAVPSPGTAFDGTQIPQSQLGSEECAAATDSAPVKTCKLSPEDDARQSRALPGDVGRPGVCVARHCIPRGRCLMQCTAKVAERRFAALQDRFQRCNSPSDGNSDCDVAAIRQEDATETGKLVGPCFTACGYDNPYDAPKQ